VEAIILAGGLGTRLRSVIRDLPKPMALIGERPFLELLLGLLKDRGFEHVVLALGYMANKVTSHFGNSFEGMALDYVVEDQPLGTGGAVRLALTRCNDDHVFVFNGDTYLEINAVQVELDWQTYKSTIIVGRSVPDTERYGRLVIVDGCVVGFTEKGISGPGLINAGCYVLGINQLNTWPLYKKFSLEADYLAQQVRSETVRLFETAGIFIDIGVPEDFDRAQSLLATTR